MSTNHKIEIFSAGCAVCRTLLQQVQDRIDSSWEVVVSDMHDPDVGERSSALGVRSVPAIAIDGVLASCCVTGGPDIAALEAAGLPRAARSP